MKLPLRSLLLGSLASAGMALGPVHAQEIELIVSAFGGAYDEAVAEGARSFEEEHGIKVTVIPGGGAANLARVRNREMDIMISDPLFSLRLERENAFVALDPELVPNLENLYPQAVYSDYTVSANFGAYVLAYDPDAIEAPTSWFDLANPEYAGRVVMRDFRPESIDLIVMFAKLAGGDEQNPDAGFEQMAAIADNVHAWANSHAEILELFRNDEVDIGTWTDGRVAWARNDEGVNLAGAIPEEGFFPLSSTINIVDGRPNIEMAQRFVNHLLSEESGIIMAERLGYFPTNRTIVLPDHIEPGMLNADNIDDLQTADWDYIVTVYDEWQQRWEREVIR